MISAAAEIRLGAAVTLLFCHGWRVSEVLGLAWEDLDLEAGTARIRRAAAYTPSAGVTLGTTKRPEPRARITWRPWRSPISGYSGRRRTRSALLPVSCGTHAGRRTVITALYADGGVDLADVARHVGHSNTSTTAAYIASLGKRRERTSRRAAELLDPSVNYDGR